MIFKRLFTALVAAAFALVACQQQTEYLYPSISVDPAELSFEQAEGSQSASIFSSRDWKIQSTPEWVAVSLAEGKASTTAQSFTVSVNANTGYDRTGQVVFTNQFLKAALAVHQKGAKGELTKGSGTLDDPYSVEGVIEYVKSLGADVQSPKNVYFQGVVDEVKTTFEASGTYGNAVFWIVDPGSNGGDRFYCYQTLYLGNKKWVSGDTEIKKGDEVIVCGKVVNYSGNTPETVSKGASYIYSLNGVTSGGGQPQSEITASTIADFIAKNDGKYYRLTGTVSSFKTGTSNGKSYMQFNLTDATATIVVYGFNDGEYEKWADKIQNNGTAVITGTYQLYTNQKTGATTHEVMNTTIESFTGGSTPTGEPKGSGTQADPYNAVAAYNLASSLADKAKSEDVYVYGKISSIKYTFSAQYGTATFNISEDGTTSSLEFTCYSVYYLGNRAWVDGDTQVKTGDDVIIYGKLTNYGGTPESASKEAYIYSLNGVTDGGSGNGGGNGGGSDEPKGSGTQADPYNAAGAIAYISTLAADAKSENDVYIAGKISSIKYPFSADYGTATFNISDDGSTSGSQFQCYSVYYLGNQAWVAGDTQIAVGDEVVICGKVVNYRGTTPETASKEAYIFSLTSGGNGGGNGGGGETGDEVVIDFASQGYGNADEFSSITVNGVTVTGSMGTNSKNGPKYYNTGSAVRFYAGNTFTVSASQSITKISLEFGSGDGTNDLSASPGTYSAPDWTGSANSVTFSVAGETGHRRVAKIKVSF